MVKTQIAIAVPKETYGKIAPRSGMAVKGIDIGTGVVDANYQGEIKVLLINHSDMTFNIKKDNCIAQFIIEKISLDELNERPELEDMNRGIKGFGSTGILEQPRVSILRRKMRRRRRVKR